MHGTWLTPPSLSELKRKEYLEHKYPQLTQDYWEVQKEEAVALAIVLQWCAVQAGTLPYTFCRAHQELHRHLSLVVEEGDWINMEKEIWGDYERPHGCCSTKGTSQDLAPVPRRQPPPPGFSPQVPEDHVIPPLGNAHML